jgi:hypothetical protein
VRKIVLALLRLILAALRDGLMAAVRPLGERLGAVVGKVAESGTS